MKAAVTAVAVAAIIASPGTSADLPQEEPLVTREDLEENVVKYTPEAERVEAVLDTAEKVEQERELAEWKKESEQYVKERDARLERERKERERKEREQRERERLEQLERERQAELERKRIAAERERKLEEERLAYERKWEEKEARETQRETTSQPVANSTQQTGQQTEQQTTQTTQTTKSTGQTRQFQVTAYVATGNPTASGVMPTVGRTVACPPEIPFGTRIHIEGVGDRICEDRGGAIHGNVLDLFVGSQEEAIAWGRRVLNVTIY